nr:methyl-CpG-binding domain-containing protein 5-like [Tanacetum cinerariifolium]
MSNSDSPPPANNETTPMKNPLSEESPDDPMIITSPDPLLGSGSFIDPTTNGTTTSTTTTTPVGNNNEEDEAMLMARRTRPSWLPENWDMILRKRASGATQGTFDRYYISPSGQRLRSKNEVVNFIATGSKKKKASSSDDVVSEGSAPPSKKKTVAKKKVHSAFTFDFKNPPEMVTWCLNNPDEDEWTPVIGDWTVPAALKQEWANVFNHEAKS